MGWKSGDLPVLDAADTTGWTIAEAALALDLSTPQQMRLRRHITRTELAPLGKRRSACPVRPGAGDLRHGRYARVYLASELIRLAEGL